MIAIECRNKNGNPDLPEATDFSNSRFLSMKYINSFFVLFCVTVGIIAHGCGPRDRQVNGPYQNISKSRIAKIHKLNVYIDNTISMDGYLNGKTEYKDDIEAMLIKSEYHYGTAFLHLNFINDTSIPVAEHSVPEFIRKLNPRSTMYNVGDRSSSDLNRVFSVILAQADTQSVGVLVSDCILSLPGNASPTEELTNQKSLTMGAFLKTFQRGVNLSTVVFKMESRFNGNYYDVHNQPTQLPSATIPNSSRPFYIWCFGVPDQLQFFLSSIPIRNSKNFRNSMVFSCPEDTSDIDYTILGQTGIQGKIKFKWEKSHADRIVGIESITPQHEANGELSAAFAIAIDLKKYPLDADYLALPSNLKLGQAVNGSITPLKPDSINPNDRHFVQSKENELLYTHLVMLKTSNAVKGTPIVVELLKSIPSWVDSTHTETDIPIQHYMSRTFGLRYLIEGVFEAYKAASSRDYYFRLSIPY